MAESISQSSVSNNYDKQAKSLNNDPTPEAKGGSCQHAVTTEERLRSMPTPLERSLSQTGSGSVPDEGVEDSNTSGTDKTASATETAAEAAGDGVTTLKEGFEALQVDSAFDQLNSDGDKLYMRMTGELKGKIQVGLKGQLGADIAITRVGDGTDADYRITLDKESLAALTGQLSIPYLPVKLEAGLQTADRVEMTFDNKEEAIRATKLLQRLAVADVASDAAGTASNGGANPVANPLTESGAPGSVSTAAVGLTQGDLAFLQGHITAYEQKVGVRGRVALEAQAPQLFLPFKASAEGRVDPRVEVTRRVELPQAGKPGGLTYTVSGDVRVSAKEKIATDPLPTNQFDAALMVQNRLEIGQARTSVSAHYDLALDNMTTSPVGGRPVLEYDMAEGYELGAPNKITVETSAEWRVQGLTDISRGDTNKTVTRFDINDISNAGTALGMLADGDIRGAAAAVDTEITTTFQQIERSGFALQSGFKLKVLEGNAVEATVILEAGVDDVVSSQQSHIKPGQTEPSTGVPSVTGTAPVDDGNTLVVVPREGASLRDTPLGRRTTVIQHGTFLHQTGQAVTGVDGSQWIPVSGTDVNDQPVSGYIYAGLTKPHDSSQGAMDPTGRTNPTLEYQRYDQVTVQEGDNLWDIAKQNNVSFDELISLNQDHLISPDLIFAGDKVYLPGTEKAPALAVDGETPAATETPTTTETAHQPPSVSAPPEETATTDAPQPGAQEGGRSTDEILQQYQVADDEVLPEWRLKVAKGLIPLPFTELRNRTKTETDLIQQLYDSKSNVVSSYLALDKFNRIVSSSGTDNEINAFRVADQYFPRVDDQGAPIPGGNDGHNDAFRHAFYSAMLTKEFGVGFSAAFGTAHEGLPGNEADREAMDLYNNELGRKIAEANPDASPKELADLIQGAIQRGEAVVIDRHGELVFSNQEAVGHTGRADDAPVDGVITPPKWNTESN
jgi:LysM repeat protein